MEDMQAMFHSRALDYRRHVNKAPHIQNIAPHEGDMQERKICKQGSTPPEYGTRLQETCRQGSMHL